MRKKADTMNEWIGEAVLAGQLNTHTALPAIIDTFDATLQRARVLPCIKKLNEITGETFDIAPIFDVPVQFPNAGGWAITFPVDQGDECLLVFCERDITGWKQAGGKQRPSSKRIHEFIDAVAILGIRSTPRALTSYSTDSLQIRNDAGTTKLSIKSTEIKLDISTTGGATFNADGSVTFKNGATITALGDFVSATGKALSTHIHSGVTTGAGNTGLPV